MSRNKSYGVFADFYDELMQADYGLIADRIDEIVMRKQGRRGILLDLACGTGTLCEKLAEKGYDVIGVDISEEMLSAALEKKYESGLPVQYLRQDMRDIDMFGTIDVTVCTLDSLNHLESVSDVKKTFEKVLLFSEPDGLFIFDVNTVYKHRNVLGNNAFVYENDDVYCVWQNFLNGDDSVDIQLDFFEKDEESGLYERSAEDFSEICFPNDLTVKLLEESGFEVLGIYDGYSGNPVKENSERAVFAASKKS